MQAALVVLAAASKTKSSSSITTFLVIGVFAVALYYLFLRPRAKRQRQARDQIKASQVGDRIVTIGGLVGTIVSEEGDEVTLSTGNGVEVTYLRQAIGRKLDTSSPSEEQAEEESYKPPLTGGAPSSDEQREPEGHDAS